MKDQRTEIREALQAADDALYYLNNAQRSLGSARNWGIADILGGGMFSTFMKHNHMENANYALSNARDALQRFASELRDVQDVDLNGIELNDFLSFADYFFDGALADWLMQSRINDSRRKVDEAISKVRSIKSELQRREDQLP